MHLSLAVGWIDGEIEETVEGLGFGNTHILPTAASDLADFCQPGLKNTCNMTYLTCRRKNRRASLLRDNLLLLVNAMKGQGSYVPPGYIPAPQSDPHDSIPDIRTSSTYQNHQGPVQWSSGICACCDDMQSCCIGFCCPCFLFGKNVEFLEGRPWTGPCLIHFLLWGVATGIFCCLTEGTFLGLLGSFVSCYACGYRRVVRTKYNLEETPCGDFMTHLFCHMCAICQEYREIKERSDGFNLSVVTAPPVQTMDMVSES